MADNNTPIDSTRNDVPNAATHGDNTAGSSESRENQRGGRFQGGRGGRGRGQNRGNKKGFGLKSNDQDRRQKKGDKGRGEYKYVCLESSKLAPTN